MGAVRRRCWVRCLLKVRRGEGAVRCWVFGAVASCFTVVVLGVLGCTYMALASDARSSLHVNAMERWRVASPRGPAPRDTRTHRQLSTPESSSLSTSESFDSLVD
jgi:hypothetical protein